MHPTSTPRSPTIHGEHVKLPYSTLQYPIDQRPPDGWLAQPSRWLGHGSTSEAAKPRLRVQRLGFRVSAG